MKGPYLILEDRKDGSLSVYTEDEQAAMIRLPIDGKISDLRQSISPDGKWLAFFTGYVQKTGSTLALNLLSLKDGTIRKITPVLAQGYPENMRPVAEDSYRKSKEPDISSVEDWMNIIQIDFPYAVMHAAWSPYSRFLAFSAQIDGPSSDIYVFELETGNIRRLVDDIANASRVEWSPDGTWILFNNIIPGSIYSGLTLSVVRADSSLVHNPKNLKGFWAQGEGWLSKKLYLMTEHGDGGEPYNIHVLNVETGQSTRIWPEIFDYFAYDPDRQRFLVCGDPGKRTDDSEIKMGLYFAWLNGSRQKISEDCLTNLHYLGWKDAEFYGSRQGERVLVGYDGTLKKFADLDQGNFSLSPDRKWLVFYDDQKIDMYAEPGTLIQSVTSMGASSILWKPDSTGLWIQSENLYFLPIPGSNPEPIPCSIENCGENLANGVWLP